MLAGAAHGADDARFVMLQLEPVGGKSLSVYGPDQAWSSVPQGLQTFDGVPFEVLAKLQLHGNVDARDNRFYSARAIGISVQQRLARLHLLHGANISETNGRPIAALRLHYVGGATYTLFVTYGVHVRNWWKNRTEASSAVSDSNSSEVWTGTSVDGDKTGATHRLYKTSFDLPPREEPVESIDAFSLFSRSSEIIVALTGEVPEEGVALGAAAPSADDRQFRDELFVKVDDNAGNIISGARISGRALRERTPSTTLGKMDDSFGDSGVVPVDFPAGTRDLRLTVSAPGYVPAGLNLKTGPGQPVRREVALKVEPGVRIGGFVRDASGQPLPRAKVEMFRATRSGNTSQSLFKYDENTTDIQGRWRIRQAPESLESLLFRVTLTDFARGEFEFSGDTGAGGLTREALLNSQAEFKLRRALNIAGVVQDESGALLPNIAVSLVHTNPLVRSSPTNTARSGMRGNPRRTTTTANTDAQGAFRFRDVNPERATLVVNNTNYAPLLRAVEPQRETGSIPLILKPGQPMKGRLTGVPVTSFTNPDVRVSIWSVSNSLARWNGNVGADGRFVWAHAPEGLLRITINHPDAEYASFRAQADGPEAEFKLKPTSTVAGTVQDEAGNLLPNVLVSLVRTNLSGATSSSSTQTGSQGTFRFRNSDPENATLVVKSPDFAPLVRAVDPRQENASITVVLKPGRPLKGQFIGWTKGNETNARVSVNVTSANNSLVRWNDTADAEGRFVWSHAPEGLLRIRAYSRSSPSRDFTARAGESEKVFDMSAAFTWTIRAVDADTKAPLEDFTITPGSFAGAGRFKWEAFMARRSANGVVTLPDRLVQHWLKIEAPGYTPIKSPMLERDSSVSSNVFALQRAKPIRGIVKLPDGRPAAEAQMGWPEEGSLLLGAATFYSMADPRWNNRAAADAQGRFELMPRLSERVVVVHEAGYAETTQSNLAAAATVTLQPWGVIEGVLMIGSKPAANHRVRLTESRDDSMAVVYQEPFTVRTDDAGKFRMTHVPPGTRWLHRLVPYNTNVNAVGPSHYMPVHVEAGRITTTTMGGKGRPVVGKVVAADATLAVDWTQNFQSIYSRPPEPLFPLPTESRDWRNSPDGRAAQDDIRIYTAVFGTNGAFRVEDVPPGRYHLNFYFYDRREPAQPNVGRQQVGSVSHEFDVPVIPGGRSDEPLDLGQLELKTRR